MDVELFLDRQARWEADSPHCLAKLHEMFQHVSEQGQKEEEYMVCRGCQHGHLKLDPEADISAIQLVGPQTSRAEFESLYYEVYKLQRLPGSPARELGLVAEVVASLEDHQGQKRNKMPQTTGELNPTEVWHPRSRTPRRRWRDASVERSLTEAREAHQKALAMAAALEEEIEWLSCPLIRSQSEAWAHSQSRDCCRHRSQGWKRRHCQVWLEDCHAPYFEYHPSQRSSESKGDAEAMEDFNLEDPLELGPEVTCFLQWSVKSSVEEDVKMPSPEPLIEEFEKWVTWRVWAYETPSWSQELVMVAKVDNHEKLACEVQASFHFPKRASEQCWVENNHQTPPALLCLCQKIFLLPPNSIFPWQDIWEIQHEKMVAYTHALQFRVEKADLPTGGKPCLLAGSVVDLQEEMKCCVSFSDEVVFNGVALLEETPIITPKEATTESALPTPANGPVKEAIVDMTVESTVEKKPPNKFLGWKKVLQPSRPMLLGRIPLYQEAQGKGLAVGVWGKGLVWLPQTKELKVLTTQLEPPSPTKELEVAWQVMPPPGFASVTVCLWRDQLPEGASHPDSLRMAVLSGPAVATISTSHIVNDEVTGVTYMDTVTTLVGWLTLDGPRQEAWAQGPAIQDVTDLI